jgi:hypothetical protein
VATYIPEALRARDEDADGGLCRYCLVSEINTGMPLTYDHVSRSRREDS